jgi:hypothetical protein
MPGTDTAKVGHSCWTEIGHDLLTDLSWASAQAQNSCVTARIMARRDINLQCRKCLATTTCVNRGPLCSPERCGMAARWRSWTAQMCGFVIMASNTSRLGRLAWLPATQNFSTKHSQPSSQLPQIAREQKISSRDFLVNVIYVTRVFWGLMCSVNLFNIHTKSVLHIYLFLKASSCLLCKDNYGYETSKFSPLKCVTITILL